MITFIVSPKQSYVHVAAGLLEAHGVLGEVGGARSLDHPEEVVGAASHLLAFADAGP